MEGTRHEGTLRRTLTPLMLWGLGTGYVISGMYFGWNLGLEKGGTLGLAIATGGIILMYLAFTFSYAELACAIPKAGGVFDYAHRAMGCDAAFVAGMAQHIEFVFAPPAIALSIGAYFNLFMPDVPVIGIAMASYLLFTGLNIYGVKTAAIFELLLFAGIVMPSFKLENLTANPLPNGVAGIFAAIPFAIWFFLGIEGVANVAEEAIDPQRTIIKGFGSAIITLVILCMLTFAGAVGVAGWEAIVYNAEGVTSDSPLPLALGRVVGVTHPMYHLLITVGIFGLVASFHGLILAGGRSTFEFGRTGFAPAWFGRIHPRFGTPANALLANTVVGMAALLTGKTAEIITIAVFGALTLYVMAMITMIRLRKQEPELERPFKAPFFPIAPWLALLIAGISFLAMAVQDMTLAGIFLSLMAGSWMLFRIFPTEKNKHI
ncbi:MAG: ethanolamine permease [Chitinophagaceae bacterium]|nr:ethanolamine permease [Chitinophagaceae bacterium]